jgi:hypothetical protein
MPVKASSEPGHPEREIFPALQAGQATAGRQDRMEAPDDTTLSGWDVKMGTPTRQTLERLGLGWQLKVGL